MLQWLRASEVAVQLMFLSFSIGCRSLVTESAALLHVSETPERIRRRLERDNSL